MPTTDAMLTSPFLTEWSAAEAPVAESARTEEAYPGAGELAELASPFQMSEAGFAAGEPGAPSALSVRAAEVFQELYDENLAEALADVVNEIAAEAGQMLVNEAADAATRSESIERQLLEQYEPIIRAGEQMFEAAAEDVALRGVAGVSELELEEILTNRMPTVSSPAFEGLFGGIRGALRKAAGVVKSLALGPALKMLGKFLRPLVQAAIKYGLNKAPAPLRGVIRSIAGRVLAMLGEAPQAEETTATGEDVAREDEDFDAAVPATELEQVFRGYLTAGLLAPDDTAREAVVTRFAEEATAAAEDRQAMLEDARERFVQRVMNLQEGESVQPAMEEFVPIVMAVRSGLGMLVRMIGRDKVINLGAGMLQKIIQKLVGSPQTAQQIARLLVAAGLKLVTGEAEAEATAAEDARAGVPRPVAEAIANTIEEALTTLAADESVLRDETLFESAVLEAFENAAATAFPGEMLRPALRPAPALGGVFQPVKRTVYLRYTKTPTVVITPAMAASVKTFGGVTLRSYLANRYGVAPDRPVRARVHVFQARPGCRLATIVAGERRIPGLGPRPAGGMRTAVTKFMPLTRSAAAVLLGEPALGRDLPPRHMADRHHVRLGGRYYYLDVLDTTEAGTVPTPQTIPVQLKGVGQGGGPRPAVAGVADHRGRSSEINVTAALARRQLRVAVFLSEPRAQEIAALIRRGAPPAAALKVIAEAAREMVATLRRGGVLNHVRIQAETMQGEAEISSTLLAGVAEHVLPRLVDWALSRIGGYLRARGREFVTATEDPKYGVTILVVFRDIPLLGTLSGILRGRGITLGALRLPDAVPQDADVQVVAGFTS